MDGGSTILVKPVPGIDRQQLDLGPLGQIGRFVEDKSPGRHSRLQHHGITVAPRALHRQGPLGPPSWPESQKCRTALGTVPGTTKTAPWSAKAGSGRRRIATRLPPAFAKSRNCSENGTETLGWGPRGRRFESSRPDHFSPPRSQRICSEGISGARHSGRLSFFAGGQDGRQASRPLRKPFIGRRSHHVHRY